MEIIVFDSAARLAEKGAEVFSDAARQTVVDRGRFAAAISGGSTPRAMHRLLTEEPYLSAVPWSKVHLFWVDERLVPEQDPASNYGAARQDFLDRSPIPPEQVHPMTLSDSPQSAASAYHKQLHGFFNRSEGGFPVFDQIFLGIGTDGHTASIFPKDRRAVKTHSWVQAVKGGKPDVHRLTLTASVINRARSVVFLVAGSSKAEVVKKVLADATPVLPATWIQPVEGRLLWLLDRAAAALLPKNSRKSESQPD